MTDSEENGIHACTRKRCVTCSSRLCFDGFVNNHVTGQQFDLSIKGSCDSKNCIYIVKCKQDGCQHQYIGHTVNHISSRIGQHKSSIKLGGGSKMLKEHYACSFNRRHDDHAYRVSTGKHKIKGKRRN